MSSLFNVIERWLPQPTIFKKIALDYPLSSLLLGDSPRFWRGFRRQWRRMKVRSDPFRQSARCHRLSSPEMKRFLLSNPENTKWVENQEKRHKSQKNVQKVARLVRREMFPELHPETVMLGSAACSISIPQAISIEARQRQPHRTLMKELLSTSQTKGKKRVSKYRTMTWKQRSKAIFFYFHESWGNQNAELTCSIFSINFISFQNWIKQRRYFGK